MVAVDSIYRHLSVLALRRSDRVLIDSRFVAYAVPIVGLRRKVTSSMFTHVDGNRRGPRENPRPAHADRVPAPESDRIASAGDARRCRHAVAHRPGSRGVPEAG